MAAPQPTGPCWPRPCSASPRQIAPAHSLQSCSGDLVCGRLQGRHFGTRAAPVRGLSVCLFVCVCVCVCACVNLRVFWLCIYVFWLCIYACFVCEHSCFCVCSCVWWAGEIGSRVVIVKGWVVCVRMHAHEMSVRTDV
jgi:hypothetical protein